MDIAMIAPPWLPVPAPAYGGTEAVLDELASGFEAAGHNVLLVCHPDSRCPVPQASVIPAEDTVRMGRMSIELEHAIGAYELVQDADIVHDNTLAGPVYSARFPSLPVVTTNHNPFTRTYNAIYNAVVPRVGLVAISESHASSTHLPVDAVIHHGINVDNYPFGAGDGGYVALLGRMVANKGVHRAIAVARAAGMRLKIAAKMREPGELAYFQKFVEPHLSADIEYVGEVGITQKLELLCGAVALLNPIQWPEPFGMVMIEALACGTPVVGCPQGAAPEIIDHGLTGFLDENLDALAVHLQSVDQLSRSRCRAQVKERFSVERMVARHVQVYREVAAARDEARRNRRELVATY